MVWPNLNASGLAKSISEGSEGSGRKVVKEREKRYTVEEVGTNIKSGHELTLPV